MLKNKILNILFYVFAIWLFSSLFIFKDYDKSNLCQSFEIVITDSLEHRYLDMEEVENMVLKERTELLGKPISQVNTLNIEKILKKNPIIRRVNCYVTPNNKVRVDIEQRTPIIRIMTDRENYFIDTEGALMPVTYNYSAYVPIATGHITSNVKERLSQFAQYIYNDPFWRVQIQQVHILDNLEVELTPRVGKQTIELGTFDDFEQKLKNLYTFYHKGLNKKGWNTYKAIKLKYDKQVIGVK